QFLDRQLIFRPMRFAKGELIAEPFIFLPVYHLSHADVGVQPVRVAKSDIQANNRAPAMSKNKDFLLAIFFPQIADEFHPILRHLLDGDGLGDSRRIIIGGPALACTALIPLHHSEEILPWALIE